MTWSMQQRHRAELNRFPKAASARISLSNVKSDVALRSLSFSLSRYVKRFTWSDFRAGSVDLNSFGAVAKWVSAFVMLRPGLAAAR